MDGIIVIDKPAGFTSFDVVAKLRGILATRKIGHGGTLDPMATGVLPVFVGTAAKAVDLQDNQDKTYEATLLLGLATDTGDIEGEVLRSAPVNVGRAQLLEVLPRFIGPQQQLPPMYSAVKINGKPLYRYAREGQTVQRKLRDIVIHSIDLLEDEPGEHQYRLRVHCSKGTYIRTLAEDIGTALGLPATLAALRRTQAGIFSLAEAHTLAETQQAKDEGALHSLLLPVGEVFRGLPAAQLSPEELRRLQNGAPVYCKNLPPGRHAVYCEGSFAGLAAMRPDGTLRAEKMFSQPPTI